MTNERWWQPRAKRDFADELLDALRPHAKPARIRKGRGWPKPSPEALTLHAAWHEAQIVALRRERDPMALANAVNAIERHEDAARRCYVSGGDPALALSLARQSVYEAPVVREPRYLGRLRWRETTRGEAGREPTIAPSAAIAAAWPTTNRDHATRPTLRKRETWRGKPI